MKKYEEVRPAVAAGPARPVIGETTEGLAEFLVRSGTLGSPEHFLPIRRDALAILSRSRPFNGPDGALTGLVVGYVQSGKTLSMTAVTALARDNGCRVIVVLAGVTNLLLDQTAKRFRKDLRAAAPRAAWRIVNSHNGLGDEHVRQLQAAVAEWQDPAVPDDEKQVVLFVVLKNHLHLDQLGSVLRAVNLKGVPALVIDDEADQAGLNTSPDAPEASRTYRNILQVRAALPHHTYLQYTATPQAPLLIALDDILSPAFAELVEPGVGYTGGTHFFGPTADPGLVRAIPADDLFKPGKPPEEPPESLLQALQVFVLGAAVAHSRDSKPPRSMLVHPSQRTADHSRFYEWISAAVQLWTATLRGSDAVDREDLLAEMRVAYAELSSTDKDLPVFEELARRLPIVLGRLSVKEVNSEDGSEIEWDNASEHILVGGEKLNRGFTVEGLTVTYMPRDAGGWNADTLQQRARFFGYKAKYLSLCRLYLHPEIIEAFRAYVRHEEDVRKQLARFRGKSLREWRRAFFLTAAMRPTRRNVLSDPYYRVRRNQVWFAQAHPHDDMSAVRSNLALVKSFESRLKFASDEEFHTHRIAELRLRDVYEALLLEYQVRGGDVAGWYATLVTIADIIEANESVDALLVEMHGEKGRERKRSQDGGAIKLQQGRGSGRSESGYPGDQKLVFEGTVTVQINILRIDGVLDPVAALAIYIPTSLRKEDVGVLGDE